MFKGAGGTSGGVMQFFLGLAMMIGGGYLFLSSIHIQSSLGLNMGLYRFGGGGGNDVNITSGMLLIPFIIGIVITFYNAKNPLGWILWLGSLIALVFGVLQSVRFSLQGLSAFELLVILVLAFGGLGLFLASLRDMEKRREQQNRFWP